MTEAKTKEEKLAQVYDGTNPEVLPWYLQCFLSDLSGEVSDVATMEATVLQESCKGKTVDEITKNYDPLQVAAIRKRLGLFTDLVYNGRTALDDAVLPIRLRTLLEILPPGPAERFRDWLTGYDIDRLEADQDYILGLDIGIRPPRSSLQEEQKMAIEDAPLESDQWAQIKESAVHIAEIFTILKKAEIPDELAWSFIMQQAPTSRSLPIHPAGVSTYPLDPSLSAHFGSVVMGPGR